MKLRVSKTWLTVAGYWAAALVLQVADVWVRDRLEFSGMNWPVVGLLSTVGVAMFVGLGYWLGLLSVQKGTSRWAWARLGAAAIITLAAWILLEDDLARALIGKRLPSSPILLLGCWAGWRFWSEQITEPAQETESRCSDIEREPMFRSSTRYDGTMPAITEAEPQAGEFWTRLNENG